MYYACELPRESKTTCTMHAHKQTQRMERKKYDTRARTNRG